MDLKMKFGNFIDYETKFMGNNYQNTNLQIKLFESLSFIYSVKYNMCHQVTDKKFYFDVDKIFLAVLLLEIELYVIL